MPELVTRLLFDDYDPEFDLEPEEIEELNFQMEDLVLDNLGEDVVE